MRKSIKLLLEIITVCIVILVCFTDMVKGEELIKGYSTAYCLKGITASGDPVQEGICAGAKKYLGKTIDIYQRLPDDSIGRHLGTFQCKDTGKTKAIKKGLCIDVWKPNRQMCQQWMDMVYQDGCKGHIYFKIRDK